MSAFLHTFVVELFSALMSATRSRYINEEPDKDDETS